MTDEAYRALREGGVDAVLAAAARRARAGQRSPQSLFFVNARLDDSAGASRRSAPGSTSSSTSAAARQPHLLPGGAAVAVRADRQAARTARASSAPPGTRQPFARLIVEKPIGRDLASATRHQRRHRRGVRRAADLPDRSLPRQGDRPEHPGPAVRQQHLRAAVQPEVHRPRADHRRRGGRRRHARRLLRTGRRAARHGAEPPAAAAGAGRDGAAVLARRRRRPRREARGASSRCGRSTATTSTRTSCARSTPRGSTSATGAGLSRANAASLPTRGPKRSSRCRCSSTTGAGPACRSSCAPASGCRSARARSRSTSRSVPPILFNNDPPAPLEPNVLTIRIQPDEGFALGHRLEGAGTAVSASIRCKMDFRYSSTFGASSPEAYERLLLDVMDGDADALHAPRRGRGVMAMDHADPRAMGATADEPLPTLSGRRLGARRGRPADRDPRDDDGGRL